MSKYLGKADWSDIEAIANTSYSPKEYLQKEFVQLVRIAKKQYKKNRKKNSD
jgi:hypothetical protein